MIMIVTLLITVTLAHTYDDNDMLETAVLSGGGLLYKHWSELSPF